MRDANEIAETILNDSATWDLHDNIAAAILSARREARTEALREP